MAWRLREMPARTVQPEGTNRKAEREGRICPMPCANEGFEPFNARVLPLGPSGVHDHTTCASIHSLAIR